MIYQMFAILALFSAFSANSYAGKMMLVKNTSLFPNQNKSTSSPLDGAKKVVYFGGPVISHAQVYLILWGDKVSPSTKTSMPDFYASVLNSDYMDWLKVYNTVGLTAQDGQHQGTNQTIGRGTFVQSIQINPAILSGKVDDTQIQAELEKQIKSGVVPAPTADSLYMIHFPPGLKITMTDGSSVATSCQQFCAFHNGFKSKTGSSIYYSVIPDLDSFACSMGCGSNGSLARISVSSSHELIEAITDPFPTPGTNPSYPQAWNTLDGYEVGDLCQSSTATLKGKAGNYFVQQEFDNSTNACTTAASYQ